MKKRIFLFGIFAVFTLSFFSLYGLENSEIPDLEKEEIETLREWIKARKQQVTVKEKGGNLSISGEVRTELQSTNEKKSGRIDDHTKMIRQRGSGSAFPNTARRAWDVELNLMLNYQTERTWANIKIEFDNNAGTVTGTFNRISLERAFFGGRFANGDLYNMDIEFGRRNLGYTFDSKVEFGSFMDGILFKYNHALEGIGDLYFNGGPFVVNENIDQFAYVGELGLLNIGGTGLYSKLSYIDWDTKQTSNKLENWAFSFRNFQLTLGYKYIPEWLDKVVTLYAAGLANTAAEKTVITKMKPLRYAWYAGFSIGELRKQWDWSFDINYQWVQAQAVPDFDGSGIGRGNAAGLGLYSTSSMGRGFELTSSTTVGAGNYKGFAAEFLYNLTRNITVYQAWRQSITCTPGIGPAFSYKQYEVELIYAF